MKHLNLNGFSPVDARMSALVRETLLIISTNVLLAGNQDWFADIPNWVYSHRET